MFNISTPIMTVQLSTGVVHVPCYVSLAAFDGSTCRRFVCPDVTIPLAELPPETALYPADGLSWFVAVKDGEPIGLVQR